MNKSSRIDSSIKNIISGLIGQVIIIVLGFINRSVFIHFLSIEYLGINGVFSNLLTMLSLAELGVGSSIIYSLYKPLANNDEKMLQSLMQVYSKAYKAIALVIAIIGVILIPYLPNIIKTDIAINNINTIYILYLANTVISYLYSYKRSIISADQKEYINSNYKYKFNILKSILQMIFLYFTRDFIIYLLIQILCTFIENICISIKANKLYPFLKYKNSRKLPKDISKELITNIKATMIYKVSGALLDGTDNIIISSIVGISWVGLLANYNILISSIKTVVDIVMNSMKASLGNLIAKDSIDRQEYIFYVLMMISFWIYGLCSICLYVLLNPFIELWLGKEFILDKTIVLILVANFYIVGMQSTVWMYRSTMGLFKYGKWRPVISAILNIIISIFLAKKIGLAGVLLGTTISRIITNVWYDPVVIFKYGFKKKPYKYYYIYNKYLIITICLALITLKITSKFKILTYSSFIAIILMCILIPNILLIVLLFRKEEFKYIYNIIKSKLTSTTS